MKNDSWLFPFSMPNDSFFDSNRDGKLSGFESIMRDTYWLEVQHRWNEENSKSNSNDSHSYMPPQPHSRQPHVSGCLK